MIEMRRAQLSFGDGLIAEEVSDLREDWMKHADRCWRMNEIVAAVYEALAKRHPKSRCRGRPRRAGREWCCACWSSSTSATGAMRCWSARCGPIWCTATSPAWAAARCRMPRRWAAGAWRWGRRCSSRFMKGVVRLARDKGVMAGRRMRVDTTVVETNIHYPTD